MSKQVTVKALHIRASAEWGDIAADINTSMLNHPRVETDTLMEHRYPSD